MNFNFDFNFNFSFGGSEERELPFSDFAKRQLIHNLIKNKLR